MTRAIATCSSLCLLACLGASLRLGAQAPPPSPPSRDGSWYVYWGWNEDHYTRSDIRFTGEGYDFTLQGVRGVQRQAPFTAREFLNPFTVTIPQFNFRVGRYVRPDLDVSIGMDHMKYVVKQGQTVGVRGEIAGTGTEHDGVYEGQPKQIRRDWLQFEHTDGLNYFHVDLRKHHRLVAWRFVDLEAFEGGGVGVLTPRTDATIFGRDRHDRYRLAGYALAGVGGLNLTLWRYAFVQCELKGGFFHITSARTTPDPVDRARHSAFFGQAVVAFGGRWALARPPTRPR